MIFLFMGLMFESNLYSFSILILIFDLISITRSCRGGTSFFCWPKRRKQENGLGIAYCPLLSQKAIPVPYVKLPQQGPNKCDTLRIHSAPVEVAFCLLFFLHSPSVFSCLGNHRKKDYAGFYQSA